MDEKLWPSCKVCDYTFNFMAMSCFLRLTILWHLSKATRLFLVTCVHYNYKWVTNLVIDFQFSSSDIHFMVSRPSLSSNNSLFVLKLCSLNPMATRLTCLEFHRVIFKVSRILLIASSQGLLNLLLTNCWVNLWKNVTYQLLQTCTFLKKIHGMCKHHPMVVFHILLWNVYNLF